MSNHFIKIQNFKSLNVLEKSNSSKFSLLLTTLGLYTLSKIAISSFKWIHRNFFTNEQDLLSKYGDGWVIITGASDGIGFAYVVEFISKGHKVLLIARNESKLKDKIDFILKVYPSSKNNIKYITFDFNKYYSDTEYNELKTKIEQTIGQDEISILVNNVGVSYKKSFSLLTNEEIHSMLNVNVASHVFMMKIVLEKMERRTKRSLVLTSGSFCGRMRFKGFCIYSATKSFLETCNECLNKEYENIDFTYFEIGPVDVNMPLTIHPKETVNEALKRAGKFEFVSPHIKHDILRTVYWNCWIVRKVVNIDGDKLKN